MKDAMKKVLFVCTGNICRSPTAEGILRKRAEEGGLKIHTDSVGTHGYHAGEAPDQRAIRAAAKRGYALEKIKARRLEAEDFEKFDYLIALDNGHLHLMQKACPSEHKHKLHTMMQFAPQAKYAEVPDPYYGPPTGFELVLDLLEEAVDGLLVELQRKP
jgi:protein-tyrosine phosphatase